MWRHFITLYVLLVVSAISIDFLMWQYVLIFHEEAFVEDLSKDYRTMLYTIETFSQDASEEELREVLTTGNKNSNFPIVAFSISEFEKKYPQAIAKFNEYNLYTLDFDEQEILYKMESRDTVLKLGPMDTISEIEELDSIDGFIFWLLMAVVLLLWHMNLFRKLGSLEKQVVAFGEGDLSARASEKPGVRIGKLNATFNSMAEKTSQLVLQNRQLIRAVSHELRAPISRLRCQVDLLDVDRNRSQNATYLDDMSVDITELETLVAEILNYSRLDASDNFASKSTEQNLKPILEALLNTMSREFGKDINLVCNANVCARIDKTHFRRAVGNLIQNAVRYCADTVEVSVEVDENNALICIHIDDDGPGIPEDERVRIFEPFARLDQSRARDSGGYGLGLAIVKQIAQLQGGSVTIGTSPLSGARFTLVLPDCSGT